MFYPGYRLVARSDTAVTRPALERAKWRCEHCHDPDDLRVIEHRGTILVVCDACRVKVGQPLSNTQVKNTKVKKIDAALASEIDQSVEQIAEQVAHEVGFPLTTPSEAVEQELLPTEDIVKAR